MALRDFKVLTFDVVGTLIDFEGGMLAYLRRAAPGHPVTDDAFLAAYRAARKQEGTGWYPDDLERCWHVVAQALGLPDSDALARGLRDSVADWPAFPDSVEALQQSAQLRAGKAGTDAPFVRGHRIELLSAAVEPLRPQLGEARFRRVLQALSLVYGTEVFLVLKDIWHLDAGEICEVARWTAQAILRQAQQDASQDAG
ncbi:hypothetical protein [Acidovorax sp. FG27]|uniref:hypothetical protein n=1 Tax=Acidovorax sp. FG27 TaxID=3133652 RepID=UPI0030E9BB62